MAEKVSVDTGKVLTVAKRISTINRDISREFENMEDAVQRLHNNWNSRAASHVIRHFHSIKNTLKENRYSVMDDYSRFLSDQVSDGYNKTESTNKRLADSFK